MMKSTVGSLAMLLLTLSATSAKAQGFRWPENPKNIQVLPDDVTGDRLGAVMRAWTGALGVRCEHCHVGQGSLADFDFASDDKPAKDRARVMVKMVQAINGTHLAELEAFGVPAEHRARVTCETCHRGIARPVALSSLLLAVIDSSGVDAAVARYGELRKRYYGSAAYDFSRGSLTAVAERLLGQSKFAEAVTIMQLELANTGEDVRTLVTLGSAQVQAGDREGGRQSLERALAIAPENAKAMVQRQMDRLLKP